MAARKVTGQVSPNITHKHAFPRAESMLFPAVVTGCTSGIGREFAVQLSKAGFKLLLISRNEASLKALQAELSCVWT
jgi:FlaA1/EpsC-like NDP-sugar epimerase